ncbi:MAG: tetratricopeptide repeat protein [Anaerolineales bacterium]|nr:tetratricopeptide repeat protein [Anaerolineales bacterium]
MIVTFYSYKGGVGRSMALANIAVSLAKEGKKVLIVDWDLEAPGLSKFFNNTAETQKGLIDIFYDYQTAATGKDEKFIKKAFPRLDNYISQVKGYKNIKIIGPGLDDGKYNIRVNEFDWEDFYSRWNGGAFIKLLRQEFQDAADFVLIDSRTGITDIGGICTLHLPDAVLLFSGMNEQNLQGVAKIATRIKNAGDSKEIIRDISLLPVLSRVEMSLDPKILDEWFSKSVDLFKLFLPDSMLKSANYYFEKSLLKYIPALAFGEEIITTKKATAINELAQAYEYISSRLIELEGKPKQTYKTSLGEIVIHFQKVSKNLPEDAPVPISIHFGEQATRTYDFVNPLTEKDLGEIRWYLEKYPLWPVGPDRERAHEIEGKLSKWGRNLFDAIFSNQDAIGLLDEFNALHSGGRVLTIDTTESRVLRLPWELLRDDSGYLFSKKPPISIRRRMHRAIGKPIQSFDLPVRVLMVTCRPDGVEFIDPRSIAEPLLDALDDIPEKVEVEFLRPPTLVALDKRLRDPDLPRVHIVHFEGYGIYDKGMGLGFLLFEDEDHQKHAVDAEQLGTLLNESGIPLMVVNACQSAQPDELNPFANVASRLIESGLGGVVVMNYSMLVETAKHFTRYFYGELARGSTVAAAMDAVRRGLFTNPKRISSQDKREIIHLQDWFLPVLYQQADEITPFKATKGSVSPLITAKITSRVNRGLEGGFPPAPLHGFHGRARELLNLERAFATKRIVVLHGFGGQGKTALATQAAEWFTRTGLFEQVAFVPFENGAGLESTVNEIGRILFQNSLNNNILEKVDAITNYMLDKPTLLVWDNFESILPGGNSPLKPQDLRELLDAGDRWTARGDSRLLITTRNTNIPHFAFETGKDCLRIELDGLVLSDAFDLAGAIIEDNNISRPQRDSLESLLRFLRGHPLSLQLALPQLVRYNAEQLVEQFQGILPQIKIGKGTDRNESLEVSLRFSLERLGEDASRWLARLAIFEGGALEPILLAVTEIPSETWNTLKQQLAATALIRLEDIPGVAVPYIHFHPTLTPYLRTQMEPDQFIQERYWQVYYQFSNQLYNDDTQHPIEVRAIAIRELPNLRYALRLCVATGTLDAAADFGNSINRFLDIFGRFREQNELLAEIEKAVGQRKTDENQPLTRAEYLMGNQRGVQLLQSGRSVEAEKIFRQLLNRLESSTENDASFDRVILLGYLGRSLRAQGRLSEAARVYIDAIDATNKAVELKDKPSQASVLHADFADVLTDLGDYLQARREYELSLQIARGNGDERSVAVLFGQLGTLSLLQGDLKDARQRHQEALNISRSIGESRLEAVACHQLGRVAQEEEKWDEAENWYKESISISEKIGDLDYVVSASNQLARVAENAGRLQDAERWYKQAINLGEKLGDHRSQVIYYRNLANLNVTQKRFDQAETYARRAVEIEETLGITSQSWKTFSLLAEIAEKRGNGDEARDWRKKEQMARQSQTEVSEQEGITFPQLLEMVERAAGGDKELGAQLFPAMQKMASDSSAPPEIQAIGKVLAIVLAGDRNPSLNGLPDELASAIRGMLGRLKQ